MELWDELCWLHSLYFKKFDFVSCFVFVLEFNDRFDMFGFFGIVVWIIQKENSYKIKISFGKEKEKFKKCFVKEKKKNYIKKKIGWNKLQLL
jgi:hypothetical protein